MTNKRSQEKILFALDVIFFIAALVPIMPVVIRWFLWFLCFTMTVFLAQTHFEWPKKTKHKVYVTTVGALVFITSFQSLAHTQWRGEKAAALSGILAPHVRWYQRAHAVSRQIELGHPGFKFIIDNPADAKMPLFLFFREKDKLLVELINEVPALTTELKDKNGKVIVTIERNHWTVNRDQGIVWDKNYSDDALEVKDGRGKVVLQVRALPDRIQVLGEWHSESGDGWRITQDTEADGEHTLIMPLCCFYDDPPYSIVPIFKYPSSEHWGEFTDEYKKQ
jgi:hypothetical protein